jgi:hypothetical protein
MVRLLMLLLYGDPNAVPTPEAMFRCITSRTTLASIIGSLALSYPLDGPNFSPSS